MNFSDTEFKYLLDGIKAADEKLARYENALYEIYTMKHPSKSATSMHEIAKSVWYKYHPIVDVKNCLKTSHTICLDNIFNEQTACNQDDYAPKGNT